MMVSKNDLIERCILSPDVIAWNPIRSNYSLSRNEIFSSMRSSVFPLESMAILLNHYLFEI